MAVRKENESDLSAFANWKRLLDEFRKVENIEKLSKKDTEILERLKEEAKTTPLTFRQLQGILSRCDNKLNGTYGNGGKSDYEANTYDKKRMENKGIA